MLRISSAAAFLCAVIASSAPAEARHHTRQSHQPATSDGFFHLFGLPSEPEVRLDRGASAAIGLGRRPRAWCGWWMRQHLGVTNPAGNLARWWAGYGSPSGGPELGALVVWRHHVGIITGRAGGHWIVKSGNDGHRVRERPRSVASAIAFRWPA
jgi:hypothetical protein